MRSSNEQAWRRGKGWTAFPGQLQVRVLAVEGCGGGSGQQWTDSSGVCGTRGRGGVGAVGRWGGGAVGEHAAGSGLPRLGRRTQRSLVWARRVSLDYRHVAGAPLPRGAGV